MSTKIFAFLLGIFFTGVLSSCEPTYPAKTLAASLTKLVREEQKIDITPHISGKTLWVFVPMTNLVDDKTMAWNKDGLELLNKVLTSVHRVILSSDAKMNFIAFIGADIKKFGVAFEIIEYAPDLQEAVLEKFSRGEFFMRSVREVNYSPALIGDTTGESLQYHDITMEKFICLQIIHRARNLFIRDKVLKNLFEIKTTSWNERFGVFKLDFEFLKKRYDLTAEEEKIKPLNYITMIASQVINAYNYKNLQAVEIKDTFSGETVKATALELKKIKIKLPEFTE